MHALVCIAVPYCIRYLPTLPTYIHPMLRDYNDLGYTSVQVTQLTRTVLPTMKAFHESKSLPHSVQLKV